MMNLKPLRGSYRRPCENQGHVNSLTITPKVNYQWTPGRQKGNRNRSLLLLTWVFLLEERNADNRRGRSKMSATLSAKVLKHRLRKRSRGGLFFVK